MTFVAELLRHTAIYGVGQVAASLISFALVPLYTRALSPDQYGALALLQLLQAVFARVYDLGLTNAVGRFYFDNERERDAQVQRLLSTATMFLVAYSAALSLVLILAARSLAVAFTGDAAQAENVAIVAVTLFVEAIAIPALTIIRMQERSRLWVALTLVRVILSLGLNVWLVGVRNEGVRGILISQAISATVVLLLAVLSVAKSFAFQFQWSIIRAMLAFGLPFLPVLLGVLVVDLSDRYLLQWLRSPAEVGVYAVGYKFGQVMMLAVSAFSMGWAPLRYKILSRPNPETAYSQILTYFSAAAAVCVVGLSVLGDEVVRIATTAPYFAAAHVIPLIAGSYAVYGVQLIVSTGMGVTKKTVGMSLAVIAGAAGNVGLNLVLIPAYGMMGAAAATLAAYLVMVAITWYASQRVYTIHYQWQMVGVIALSAALVVALDSWAQPESRYVSTALGIVLLTGYIVFLWSINAIPREEIRHAWRRASGSAVQHDL